MKLITHTALSVTVFVSSLATARPSDDFKSPRRFQVEKVILTEGDRDLCVVDTAGRSDLVPSFLRTSTEASSSEVELRNCEASEIAEIQQLASISVRKADVAALPAVAIGAIAICAATAGMGAYGGFTETPFIGMVAMTTPPAMMAKGAWWMGPKIAMGLSAVILSCGAAGYFGSKGLKYLLTSPDPS